MLTLADFFSSLITVGGFSFTNSDISMSKYTTYAISTASVVTNASAKEEANICKNRGGAGYVYMADDKFYIIAGIYENEADAKKVAETLKTSNITSTIIQIDIPLISLKSSLSPQEKSTLENSITIFKTTYKKLYDISVSLDTSVISEVNARLAINELGSEISTATHNFNTMFNSQMNSELVNVKIKLNDLLSEIDQLISSSYTPFTSHIKNAYCSSLFLLKSLAESLAN